MRYLWILLMVVAAPCMAMERFSPNFELQGEDVLNLDGEWGYLLDGYYEAVPPAPAAPPQAAEDWQKVRVPGDLERVDPATVATRRGEKKVMVGWLRRSFEVMPTPGRRTFLYFTGVSRSCDIYVNGRPVARHEGMYDAFDVEISDAVAEGANELVVRFEYPLGATSDFEFLGAQDFGHSQTGIGIWASVRLFHTSPVFVRNAWITPERSLAKLTAEIELDGAAAAKDVELTATLLNAAGTVERDLERVSVSQDRDGRLTARLPFSAEGLARWTLEAPTLYRLRLTAAEAGRTDTREFRFGVRHFGVRARSFVFNGRPIHLRSMLMWSGHTMIGRDHAEARAAAAKFVEQFREKNLNIVRTAHSMPNPALFEVADERGLLVYLELGNQVAGAARLPAVAREMRRLARQIYNHPSLVMYSLGNEVWQTQYVDAHGDLYEAVREEDASRPITAVSGGHTWPSEPDRPYEHTDFFDLHNYAGHMDRPWNQLAQSIRVSNLATLERHYGRVDRPLFMGETVGMSWPLAPESERSDEPISPRRYVKIANNGITPLWASQVGSWRYFWPLGEVGGPGEANRWITGDLVRLLAEQMREMPDVVQGFCLWGDNYDPAAENKAFRDVLPSAWDVQRHPFAGQTYTVEVKVSNLASSPLAAGGVRLKLEDAQGRVVSSDERALAETGAVSVSRVPVRYSVPADAAAGVYRLVMDVLAQDGTIVSSNDYAMQVSNWEDLRRKAAEVDRPIVLLADPGGRYKRLADRLGLQVQSDVRALGAASGGIAILSYGGGELPARLSPDMAQLQSWVEAGGRLLVDRLPVGSEVPCVPDFRAVQGRPLPSVEVVAPTHPLFAEMREEQFFFWRAPLGDLVGDGVHPLTGNVLVGKGFDQNTTMAVSGFRVGEGVVVVNQLWSAEAADAIGSAAEYSVHLLRFLASSEAADHVLPPAGGIPKLEYEVPLEEAFFANLSSAANMAYTDEVADDGQGGWTDQGPMHPRLEAGVQLMGGVPFRIPDEEGGTRPTCIALYGYNRPSFPRQSELVPINRKLHELYFLHTAAWCNKEHVGGRPIMHYLLRYEDGRLVEVPVVAYRDIGEWWNPADLAKAPVVWRQEHPTMPDAMIGLYAMRWENPYPDSMIMSVQVRSEASGATPIVVGITGR